MSRICYESSSSSSLTVPCDVAKPLMISDMAQSTATVRSQCSVNKVIEIHEMKQSQQLTVERVSYETEATGPKSQKARGCRISTLKLITLIMLGIRKRSWLLLGSKFGTRSRTYSRYCEPLGLLAVALLR